MTFLDLYRMPPADVDLLLVQYDSLLPDPE
jgi:hypothetical protein